MTDTFLRGLPATGRRYEITDPSTTGLQIRVEADGDKTWLFRFQWRGQSTRMTLGEYGNAPRLTLARARQQAQVARSRLDDGIDPRRARPKPQRTPGRISLRGAADSPNSVETLAAEFLSRHVRKTRKRPEYVERILDADILPHFAGRDARTVTPREIVEFLDEIVERGSPVMANRVANILSQMFRFGIHRAIVESSPVQLLYRPGGREKARERAFTDDEVEAFLRHVHEAARYGGRMPHVLRILLLTGQRRGEIALARRSDLDLKSGTWTIPDANAKGGRGHVVPLSSWASAEFAELLTFAGRSPYVFPTDDGTAPADPKLITRSVARSRRRFARFGLGSFTAHDLRRTCRTGLARLGISNHIAERVLNHRIAGVAGVYDQHDYLPEKRKALDKWATHLTRKLKESQA